jgi:hypothetical protein
MSKADDRAKEFKYEYKKEYTNDWDVHKDYIATFDPYEAMLLGQVYDSVSASVDNSKITDAYSSTLAKERADRVMAKLPEGLTTSVGKADVGKGAFMDLLRQKWIYPNANSQFPLLQKLNMWQLYSSVYGYMPMFYDWNVSNTGYIGPDCWLWNPRNLVPQQGRVSIADMDYVHALTYVGETALNNILDNESNDDGWDRKALALLVELVKSETTENDTEKDTITQRTRINQATKRGICLVTRYEAGPDGEWITFAPDHSHIEVRRLKNPHKNGRIPFVVKYSQPLYDSFYGLGDFQKAMPLQFARDGLTNFYFASLKRNLSPGIIVNANGVVKSTLDVTSPNPVLMETIPNSIRPMPTNTAGLATYQGVQSNLTGSLLSQFGTQNASMPGAETLNPSQGKTPAAIDMYSAKEATRDGAERQNLEVAIEQLTDGFFSLIANIGTEDIPVELFAEDIQAIVKAGQEDLIGLFDKGSFQPDGTLSAGTLKVNPAKLKGIEYRFNIDSGSTMKLNKAKQLQELERFIDNIGKFQNIIKDDPRIEIHPDKIATTFGALADIEGAPEFITVSDGPSKEELQLQQQLEQAQQQIQQMEQQAQMEKMTKEQNQTPEPMDVGGTMFTDPAVGAAAKAIIG